MSEKRDREHWLHQVEREVERFLATPPPDFARLVRALPSIDPLVVVDVLRDRAGQGSSSGAALLKSAATSGGHETVSPRPIAHPLDYDWRFTADSAAEMMGRLERASCNGGAIGYFGAPAAFTLALRQLPRRQHVLLDMSRRWPAPTSGAGRIISIDLLRDPLPALELDAALLDPPWYPEYHNAFLWAAASLVRPRGLVLASFPPLAMRPRVAAEREEIIANAMRAGLVLAEVEPLALRYATPPFERASFAAAGVRAVPDEWRRGDMLSFQKTEAAPGDRPSPPSDRAEWEFVEIDEIPLALRKGEGCPETVLASMFDPAVPGATLTSVSRRDPARASAVLWSSRNRIYKSSAPRVVDAIVRSIANGADALGAVEAVLARRLALAEEENVVAAANQVRDLIRTEREEHGLD